MRKLTSVAMATTLSNQGLITLNVAVKFSTMLINTPAAKIRFMTDPLESSLVAVDRGCITRMLNFVAGVSSWTRNTGMKPAAVVLTHTT